MRINYSIIIPHKNTPKLLERCLESIPDRDDIQVIIIDDHSDANKVDFKNFPGVGVDRIRILFSEKSKGAGAARNRGLQEAEGKWLFFADADDFFNPNFIEKADNYVFSEADIVYFSVNSVYSDTLEPGFRDSVIVGMIHDAIRTNQFDQLRYKHLGPVSKMVRNEFVKMHNLKFDETFANNDAMFSVKCGYYAKNILVDPAEIYCITCSRDSVSHKYSEVIARDRLVVYKNINQFLNSIHKSAYRVNLIPCLLCIRHWSIKSFFKRSFLLPFGYYLFFFWVDCFNIILYMIVLVMNSSKRRQFKARKNMIVK